MLWGSKGPPTEATSFFLTSQASLFTDQVAVWIAYANDFVIGFEHHRPTASRRSVRTVPASANVVAVSVVAAAAVGPGRSGSDRSGAHRGRTDTVAAIGPTPIAVAPATHCDSAAPSPSNCDSAAAVASTTAPIAATSATASIGVVGNEGDQQQGCGCRSYENSTQHQRTPSSREEAADFYASRRTAVCPKPRAQKLRALDLDQGTRLVGAALVMWSGRNDAIGPKADISELK